MTRRAREATGVASLSSYSRASATPLASGTSGGSPTCATRTAVVSAGETRSSGREGGGRTCC